MNAYDLDVHLNIHVGESDPLGENAVCGLDYFETSIQNSLYEKVQRTARPRGGKIDFDQPGKLVGDWIVPGNMGTDLMLAFVYDVNDPTQVRISIGGTLATGAGLYGIDGNAPDPATISTASGLIVYYLQEVIHGGYNQNPGNFTLLVKMLGDEQIEVEAFSPV